MPNGLLPVASSPDDLADLSDPQAVTEAFLAALAAGDAEVASALLADDVLYVNVGLPPIRGRRNVDRALRLLNRPGAGFEVYLHSVAADGPVVLTERTDVLLLGRVRAQFWVFGRFDVHDGQITLWRDAYDYLDILRATVRGLAGAMLPGVRPRAPDPQSAPGR